MVAHINQPLVFNALAILRCHALIAMPHSHIDRDLIFAVTRNRLKRPSKAVEAPLTASDTAGRAKSRERLRNAVTEA